MLKHQLSLAVAVAVAVAMVLGTTGVNAAHDAPAGRMEVVNIIGTRDDARQLPGSAFVIDKETLEVFQYSDINNILTQAPGVYLQQEEGYGLRPNIGIRGSGTDRSGKVTLMEDGILIAPAPYSNPEAYYFPTAGRMAGVEVLKGPALLQQGPQTVGGAVNLLSTPIPEEYGGNVVAEIGERGENRLLASYGGSGEQYGWLLETHQHRGDGFKDIDRSNGDSGFKKEDYMAKVRWNTAADASLYQQLDLKVQYSTEVSNMSYLGLSDADFNDDPNRRYGLTEKDQMDNRHSGINLGYYIEFSDSVDLHLTAYYNKFKRDWFKVDKIGGEKLGDIIDFANGEDGPVSEFITNAALHGQIDVPDIDIKHNNREYTSKGFQGRLDWDFNTGEIAHSFSAGLRIHRDYMDRFQPVEVYDQVNGSLVYDRTKAPTGSNNREDYGKALSFWAMDTMTIADDWDLTLIVRREDITTEREQYADPDRNVLDDPEDQRKNTTKEWLPGVGLTYQVNENWQLLGGVHKGMSPAGAGAIDGTDPEKSINYELGFRFGEGALTAEVIGFYSDYSNSIVNCSMAHPCDLPGGGETDSGTQQLGEAKIKGLEASLGYTATAGQLQLPMQLAYTFTDAKFTKDSDDGSVLDGDRFRYVPKNQLFGSVGVVGPQGWDAFLAARFSDSMCVDFSCERSTTDTTYLETDKLWVFDFITHYQINDIAQVYFKVDNLLDNQKIVSRSPAGARPNKPRTALVGLSLSF